MFSFTAGKTETGTAYGILFLLRRTPSRKPRQKTNEIVVPVVLVGAPVVGNSKVKDILC